jgi:hypothetical protein
VWALNTQPDESTPQRLKRMYGWIGIACWVLILPAKEARHFDFGIDPLVIGVAPSLLGPAGLLLVILSSERHFARLTITAATLLAGTIALGLEFAQMLPLVRRIYRFDWLDVAATSFSLCAGALVSVGLRRCYPTAGR